MTSRAVVDDFLTQRTLAVVGASRDANKFGNKVFRDLIAKGYQVFPINPNADVVEGKRCYPDLNALPQAVDGI